MKYSEYTKQQLLEEKKKLESQYNRIKAKGLKLDMSRGKPGTDQLAVSNGLLDAITSKDWDNNSGDHSLEYLNYGLLTGISECKRIFADLLKVQTDNVIVCGNSSLNLMFDYITQCMMTGSDGPAFSTRWLRSLNIAFMRP